MFVGLDIMRNSFIISLAFIVESFDALNVLRFKDYGGFADFFEARTVHSLR